jgi:aspartate racemase
VGSARPFYGLQVPEEKDNTAVSNIPDLAALYVREMRILEPQGPYLLGGHSAGGIVAFEMALQLQAEGQAVAFLGLFDTLFGGYLRPLPSRHTIHAWIQKESYRLRYIVNSIRREKLTAVKQLFRNLKRSKREKTWWPRQEADPVPRPSVPDELLRLLELDHHAITNYAPRPYEGRVTLFRARDASLEPFIDHDLGWSRITGGVHVCEVSGDHLTLLKPPHVGVLAKELNVLLDKIKEKQLPQVERHRPFVGEH